MQLLHDLRCLCFTFCFVLAVSLYAAVVWKNSRVRLDSGGPGQGAAAAERAGLHHRPEERDHQQPGPGHAEVR